MERTVSWQGLRHLCAFPRLDDLDITTGLEGRPSLEHLQDLTALRSLDLYLREPGLAPAELAHLHGLTKLKHLSLTGHVPVSDEAMKHLVNLHELEYLVLWPDSGAITDAGLSHLAGMQRLEYLQISGRITDAGLEHLAKLGSLKSLNLNTRTVTSEALAALRQRLPSLQSVTVPTGPPLKEMPKVGDAAPALVAKTFDGQTFTLAQQRGKVVLLYFWGTWCSPCVGSTPRLKVLHDELAREHGERFTMLSLSFNEASFLPRRHAERHQLGWPQTALGDDSQTQVAYGVWGAPTYFLIGPDGTVASTARDWDQIKRDVASILGGGK